MDFTTMQEEKHEQQEEALNVEQPEIDPRDKEIEDLKNQVLRSLADAENTRKRSEKEIADARKYGTKKLSEDLIDVLENLFRSTDHLTEEQLRDSTIHKIVEGIEMTRKSFVDTMSRYGVHRVAPKIGDAFDHNIHQAISSFSDPSRAENSVVQVIQAGYMLYDRLLRPALVVVSTK